MKIDANDEGAQTMPLVTSVVDDIDALIPEELREAFKEVDDEDAEEEERKKKPKAKVQEEDESEEDIDESEEELDDEGVEEDGEEDTDEEDEDLSPDAIDKILKGDFSGKKKTTEEEEDDDAYFWREEEEYQNFANSLKQLGYEEDELDKFIKRVSDKRIVDSSETVKQASTELNTTKTKLETANTEIERLRQIERVVRFDNLDSTKETYIEPINASMTEIRGILERENIPASLSQVLSAKNIKEVTDLLGDVDLDDAVKTKLNNHWRSYKELHRDYSVARNEAQKDLSKALETRISDDTVKKILRNTLSDFIKADERYGYIKTAVQDGLENHPDTHNLIAAAKQNFKNMVDAISNGSEIVNNEQWLSNLANFMFDAAHNKLIQERYYKLNENHEETIANFKKVVKEYKKLAKSAKGISGSRGGPASRVAASRGQGEESEESILDEFTKILSGDMKVTDILPS